VIYNMPVPQANLTPDELGDEAVKFSQYLIDAARNELEANLSFASMLIIVAAQKGYKYVVALEDADGNVATLGSPGIEGSALARKAARVIDNPDIA
jgi:hypothetical protein